MGAKEKADGSWQRVVRAGQAMLRGEPAGRALAVKQLLVWLPRGMLFGSVLLGYGVVGMALFAGHGDGTASPCL